MVLVVELRLLECAFRGLDFCNHVCEFGMGDDFECTMFEVSIVDFI